MGISQSTHSSSLRMAESPSVESSQAGGGCPMHKETTSGQEGSRSTTLNEFNQIPDLSQEPSQGQQLILPKDRMRSSIPRSSMESASSSPSSCPVANGDDDQERNWVYPSPQQFYNALVRKGWETPENAIPVMVDIHNWMNEAVWQQVLGWETRYFRPPRLSQARSESHQSNTTPEVSLTRFQGRPQDLSPKARFYLLLAKVFPSIYSDQKPFDRHDWLIRRDAWGPEERKKTHRYVIDYYSSATDQDGNPVFHFDVRPAIDDLDSLAARLKEWARVKQETWLGGPQATASDSQINN